MKLTYKGRQCDPPPRKIRDADGTLVYFTPGRVNLVHYTYSGCTPSRDPQARGKGSGCPPTVSVTSSPACERPHSLLTRYSVGHPLPHEHIQVRGAPAAVHDDAPPSQSPRLSIEIFTGDAAVTIASERAQLVRRAAARLVASPSSPGGARTPASPLPPPVKGAAEDNARRNPPC